MADERSIRHWSDEECDAEPALRKGAVVKCEWPGGVEFHRVERELGWREIRDEYRGVHERHQPGVAFEAFLGRMHWLGHWSHYTPTEAPATKTRRTLRYTHG